MAVFLPWEKEDGSTFLTELQIHAFEELQEMESSEQISKAALTSRLCLKFSRRPWSETGRLVHACMDKPKTGLTTLSKSPISSCLEKLKKAISDKALFDVMNKLEFLSRQKRFKFNTSPSGTAFYMTSEMFKIEIQLKTDGEVIEVKLAHLRESPQICEGLLEVLRYVYSIQVDSWHLQLMKNYDAFGKVLDELHHIYQNLGDSNSKAQAYLALKSLERDITSLSLLYSKEEMELQGQMDTGHRLALQDIEDVHLSLFTVHFLKNRAPDMDRISEILFGKVGYLRPRTAGTPMNLEFYLSPMQILEEQLTPGLQVPGVKVFVMIGRSDVICRLPLHPLIGDSWTDGHPVFVPLTEMHCMDFPACFFLKFDQPFPMSSACIQKLQKITGFTINGLNLGPLHELIVQQTLSKKHEGNPAMNNFFIVSLPDCPKHCYYIGNGTGASCLTGAMVSNLPFTHPKDVPDMIEVLRHQAAYNTLVSSCISAVTKSEVSSYLLHFEIRPVKASSFSVTFQQPGNYNLACVLIDVPSSKEVKCTLYTLSKDWSLNMTEELFARVLKRCMSVPILMRTIYKKAAELKPADPMQGIEETSDESPQGASESADVEGSGGGLQNAGIAWESWSPDIADSLETSSKASLSNTSEGNATSMELLDDRTESLADTDSSSSGKPVSSHEIEALLLSLSEDISRDEMEEGATDEPWTSLKSVEDSKAEGDASEKS